MEVYFRAREDFLVVHEPFADSYWQGSSAEDKLEELLQITETSRSPVFVKDIAHHLPEDLRKDQRLIQSFSHVILVRTPLAAFHSHLKVNPDVKDHEFGYQALYAMFQLIQVTTGVTPLVLLADDIQGNPATTIESFCKQAGIDHLPEALSWQAKQQNDWKASQKWQEKAAVSTGFESAGKREFPSLPARLEKVFKQHQDCYLKLLDAASLQNQELHSRQIKRNSASNQS